jgi:oxygen-independent coproporphyrinogen-3 oxidase
VRKELEEAERRGLLVRDHERIKPTPLGRRFLNDLQAIFLRSEPLGEAQPAAVPMTGP